MANNADPDQLASSEANWSGSSLFAKAGYIRVQQDKGNCVLDVKVLWKNVWSQQAHNVETTSIQRLYVDVESTLFQRYSLLGCVFRALDTLDWIPPVLIVGGVAFVAFCLRIKSFQKRDLF